MQIIVASKNPVKLKATLQGFKKMFPEMDLNISGVSVESNVQRQPMSDKETFAGALNRAESVSKKNNADYWVGIEGGLEKKDENFMSFAWIVIKSKEGKIGKGRSAAFFLPDKVGELIKQGYELSDACDQIFSETSTGKKQGAIGILTNNITKRTTYYTEAIVLALIPFNNIELYD